MSIIYTKEQLIQFLKDYIDKNGIPKNIRKCFNNKNKLPSYNTYEKFFGKGLDKWIELTGYKLNKEDKFEINKRNTWLKEYSKEEVVKIIEKMQLKLNRPLMYDDFRNPQKDEIGITYIKKYFGTMNKMKEELGLEIVQNNMIDLHLTKQEFIQHINEITEMFYNEYGSKILTTDYFNELKEYRNYITYWNWCKKYFQISLREYLNNIDFDLIKCGQGHSFYFEDGEVTVSKHEKIFSLYLRDNLKLIYNQNYFRNVKYSKLINVYNGLMNCDYIIYTNQGKICIEIAEFLRDYKSYYLNNNEIKSQHKENYRLKLKEKENMLIDNNLKYFILFPDELNIKYLDLVFKEVN